MAATSVQLPVGEIKQVVATKQAKQTNQAIEFQRAELQRQRADHQRERGLMEGRLQAAQAADAGSQAMLGMLGDAILAAETRQAEAQVCTLYGTLCGVCARAMRARGSVTLVSHTRKW